MCEACVEDEGYSPSDTAAGVDSKSEERMVVELSMKGSIAVRSGMTG